MAWQGLKLNLRVSQKQILTPGLVQMVSVLALNRLELREMINQEMIANPVLINRPIVVTETAAKLCRPSETVKELLGDPATVPCGAFWPPGTARASAEKRNRLTP